MYTFASFFIEEDEQSSKLPQWVIVSKQNLVFGVTL